MNRKLFLMLIFFNVIFFLNFNASGNDKLPQNKEVEALQTRIVERMEGVLAKNWGKVYSFFNPNYRKEIPKEEFIYKPRNVTFKEYRIESIDLKPGSTSADVLIRATIQFQGFTMPNVPQSELWIKEKGEWFLKESIKPKHPISKPSSTKEK